MNIPPELAWIVNKNKIEQAFLALINNAIDAMEQKGCHPPDATLTGFLNRVVWPSTFDLLSVVP
ncbi:MAG: hypothetical protein ABIW76_22950 [Fibrobacteria bacterium]